MPSLLVVIMSLPGPMFKMLMPQSRIEYMESLGTCFDVPPDPQVEHVITLLCQVFQTTSALMALVDSDRIYVRRVMFC